MAILSGMSLTLANLTQQEIHRSENRKIHNSLYYIAMRGEALAMAAMTNSVEKKGRAFHAGIPNLPFKPSNLFPEVLPHKIKIDVVDLQGRFNISNLISKADRSASDTQMLVLENYCKELSLPVTLCLNLRQEIEDQHLQNSDSETVDYTRLFEAVRKMIETGQINQAQSIIVANAFTSLPKGTAVNLYTAPATLLDAIVPNLGRETIKEFIASRDNLGPRIKALNSVHPALSALSRSNFPITTDSKYFAINTVVQHKNYQKALQSVIRLDSMTGSMVLILRRSLEFPQLDLPLFTFET
ncbi:MAG: hypothetical protein AB8B81_16625 [Halioglobus sp.]